MGQKLKTLEHFECNWGVVGGLFQTLKLEVLTQPYLQLTWSQGGGKFFSLLEFFVWIYNFSFLVCAEFLATCEALREYGQIDEYRLKCCEKPSKMQM